jgi:hypothetical protein
VFDLFIQTPVRATNSLWEFFDDIFASTEFVRAVGKSSGRNLTGPAMPDLRERDVSSAAQRPCVAPYRKSIHSYARNAVLEHNFEQYAVAIRAAAHMEIGG